MRDLRVIAHSGIPPWVVLSECYMQYPLPPRNVESVQVRYFPTSSTVHNERVFAE